MCGRSEGVREVEGEEGARNTACDLCVLLICRNVAKECPWVAHLTC